jgi:hypothetical protein
VKYLNAFNTAHFTWTWHLFVEDGFDTVLEKDDINIWLNITLAYHWVQLQFNMVGWFVVLNASFHNISIYCITSFIWGCRSGRDRMVGGFITTCAINQCLSPLKLRVRVLDTTLCDKVFQWLVTVRCFSLGIPVSST